MKHRQGGLAANFFDMNRLGIRAVLNRCAGVKWPGAVGAAPGCAHNGINRVDGKLMPVDRWTMGEFYKASPVGADGRIAGPAIEIFATNDEDAIEQAQQLADGRDLELWRGTHMVGPVTSRSMR